MALSVGVFELKALRRVYGRDEATDEESRQ
jgi:hypothetical protein